MSKLNEYPSVNSDKEFTPKQKAAFLGSASVISTGPKGGSIVTANIPFSEFAPIVSQTYDANSEAPISGKGVASALAAKQDVISDLDTIRSGAHAGAEAYNKPAGGIPESDLAPAVQSALDKANTALTKIDRNRGLKDDDKDGIYVDIVENGGLAFTDTGALKLNIASNSGLECTDSGALKLNIASNSGLECTDSGALKLNIASNGGLECTDSGALRIKHQIPDPSGATEGQVLTISSSEDIVWADGIPAYTANDAGKVLAVKSDGTGLTWISTGS